MLDKNELLSIYAELTDIIKPINSKLVNEICLDTYALAKRIIRADDKIKDEENEFLLMCRTVFNIDGAVSAADDNIPQSLKKVIQTENDLIRSGDIPDIADAFSPTFIWLKLFATVTAEAIVCDDDISDKELAIFKNSVSSCLEYIYMNLKKIEFGSVFNINMEICDNDGNESVEMIEPRKSVRTDESKTLSELMTELNSLIGLDNIKAEVNSLICLIKVQKLREQRGMKRIPVSLHMVFSGNPGTGKTTVARLLAKIYKELGVLSKGSFVETDRSGLVGGYVGQTALKTQNVINEAIGGILFIDEAYSLTSSKSDSDYGKEAIDTIVKAMEDNRDDLIVIVAGYPELMNDFINSNPGLRSRFNKYLDFKDYVPDELCSIFRKMCISNGYKLSAEAEEAVTDYFEKLYENRDKNFGNGRDVRNKFEKVVTAHAIRLSEINDPSDMELTLIDKADFE